MLKIKKRYLLNKDKKRVGVVLDLDTFERIQEVVEDHLFGKIVAEAAREKPLGLEEARRRYSRMKKRA